MSIDQATLRWVFRLALAIPALIILGRYGLSSGGLGLVIQASGEWAVRMLVLTLAVTPLRIMFRGQIWPAWLFKHRRDLGIATFLYALLHVGAYVVRQSSLAVILYDLPYTEYLLGYIAFAGLLILMLTSNDMALRWLGTAWKKLQRLVYVAAAAVFLHWIWIKLDNLPAYLHFAPLVVLEAYRMWYNFVRPSQHRHHD